MPKVLLVMLAGGVGSGCRYLLGSLIQARVPNFPLGTITINLTGSYLIAAIMYVGLNSDLISADVRLTLTTGLIGGYTTYSTFNYESIQAFTRNDAQTAVLNIVITVFGALLTGWLGVVTGRAIVGH